MKGLIDFISNIGFKMARDKACGTFGRVYEYFRGKAAAEVKRGGIIREKLRTIDHA
jgi:hypothetical protein